MAVGAAKPPARQLLSSSCGGSTAWNCGMLSATCSNPGNRFDCVLFVHWLRLIRRREDPPPCGRQVSPRAVGGRMDCCPVSATGSGRRKTSTQYRRQLDGSRSGRCSLDTNPKIVERYVPRWNLPALPASCSRLSRVAWEVGLLLSVLRSSAEAHSDWRLVSHEHPRSDPAASSTNYSSPSACNGRTRWRFT